MAELIKIAVTSANNWRTEHPAWFPRLGMLMDSLHFSSTILSRIACLGPQFGRKRSFESWSYLEQALELRVETDDRAAKNGPGSSHVHGAIWNVCFRLGLFPNQRCSCMQGGHRQLRREEGILVCSS